MSNGLDERRIERLVTEILLPIKANYKAGPMHRDRVFEALNALAVAVAITLHGTDIEATAFFSAALTQHMDPEWIEPFLRGWERN